MDERDCSVLNRQLAATEKAIAHVHRADPLLYAELFKLRNRLQRHAERVDADSSLTRAGAERVRGRVFETVRVR
jgi:hypothetical protein